IVPGPADAVETNVTPGDGSPELMLAQARQNDDEVTSPQPELSESAIEPIPKQLGYVITSRKFYENKNAVAQLSGDPWKNRIILRQVFEQGLPAPKNWRRR